MESKVLRTERAASYCGLAPSTMEKQRLTGGGPTFVRLTGRAVGYLVADLDEWIASRRAASTSSAGPAVKVVKGRG